MKKCFYLFLFILSNLHLYSYEKTLFNATEIQQVPSAFLGRFRPLSATSEQWYYQYAQQHAIPKDLQKEYSLGSRAPLEFLLLLHFLGITPWENTPLFHVAISPPLKSYNELKDHFHEVQLDRLVDEFSMIPKSQPRLLPLKSPPGLWVSMKKLKETDKNFTAYDDASFQKIRSAYLDLDQSVSDLFVLNGKIHLENTDPHQELEIQKKAKHLAAQLTLAYTQLEGKPIDPIMPIELKYPTLNQFKAEWFYTHYPLVETLLLCYGLSLFAYLMGLFMRSSLLKKGAVALTIVGFVLHTVILVLRCYILGRPPVSNMYETIIYVPWIALILAAALYIYGKNTFVLMCGTSIAFTLLIVLRLTKMEAQLENLQAVLNSQYWLVIHVLMIVASYGAFILCGVLAHVYLIKKLLGASTEQLDTIGSLMLQTMYVGTALIIPGTILGGVWAAESWGRFWDWDPKESWAFISSCIYIAFIHAYRFQRIHYAGLAFGAILGLLSISFTWYGVNYILGTGMHTYGFGSGGEIFYYTFVLLELIFLGMMVIRRRQTLSCQ
jgi:ABC-type transport system involved in cytochrome c biogenesis permease subunit